MACYIVCIFIYVDWGGPKPGMHCPVGLMVNWQMRLTLRDSSLSGQNQAWVVVGMSQQICQRHRRTAGNVPSCDSPSTHIHCERPGQTFILLSHLLLLTTSKGLPDQSDKKVRKLAVIKHFWLYEVAAAWHFLSNPYIIYRTTARTNTFLICHDQSSSLAMETQEQYFFLPLLYFKEMPLGHNGHKNFSC